MKQPIIEVGSKVFVIESNWYIIEAEVLDRSGDFYLIRFEGSGGIRIRGSRLFMTREEAEAQLSVKQSHRGHIVPRMTMVCNGEM